MLNKHKLFLLCAKWIPVVTAIGILVINTIAYFGKRRYICIGAFIISVKKILLKCK